MTIYFKDLEKKLDKWLFFLMTHKPKDSPASWVTYKSMQKAAKRQFIKEISELFDKLTQEDVKIIEKDGKKHFLIKQSKL